MISSSMGRQAAGVIATIAFVAIALAFVAGTGRSDFEEMPVRTAPESSPRAGNKLGSVGDMIHGLEARLENDPADAKGWLLLAKSHDHLGNASAAWHAYERARKLGMSDERLELRLAAGLVPAVMENGTQEVSFYE